VECEARGGYHLREADLFFEVADPESGEFAAPLAAGRLRVTVTVVAAPWPRSDGTAKRTLVRSYVREASA
jgi:hypothetical protein